MLLQQTINKYNQVIREWKQTKFLLQKDEKSKIFKKKWENIILASLSQKKDKWKSKVLGQLNEIILAK